MSFQYFENRTNLSVGICSVTDKLLCQASSGKTASDLLHFISDANVNNGTSLSAAAEMLAFALTLQSKIILYLLAPAGVLLVIDFLLIMILKRNLTAKATKKAEKRRQSLRRSTLVVLWTSIGLALASAIATSQTTAAMEFVTRMERVSSVQFTAGNTLTVLQWLIVSFSSLFAAGISSIFKKHGGTAKSAGTSGTVGGETL
jgi:hypothetical protein